MATGFLALPHVSCYFLLLLVMLLLASQAFQDEVVKLQWMDRGQYVSTLNDVRIQGLVRVVFSGN
jgi:hypothetical protein